MRFYPVEYAGIIIKIVIGWVLMILGGSFAWKSIRAAVQGKLTYWSGFLPITVLSPFFVHSKAKDGTLIKDATGLWVHFLMGPVFLVLSALFIAIGADLAGFPGTDTLNLIIGGGNPTAPPAIVYNKNYNFRFPIFSRVGHKLLQSLNTFVVPINEKDKLLQDRPTESIQPPR